MKPKTAKKTLAFLALAAGSTLLCSGALADNNNPANPADNSQSMGNTITALATAAANAISDAVYQFDQNLPAIVQANTASNSVSSAVQADTTASTLANIKSDLQVLPQSVVPPKNPPPNLLLSMTYGTPSSDSLYSPNDPQAAVFNANPKSIPNNDNYFDVDTLIGPDAYTSDQVAAAQNYISYLNQNYNPLGSTINFSPLAGMSYSAFNNFMRTNTVYQTYQAQVRSFMAMNSVVLSNFNHLMAERTVQPGLGTSVGLTQSSPTGPQPVADASPLQVADYIANHRTNNVQWYQSMASASPTTVQRETLFVLAEMEGQLQQMHLDNERLLTTLSALVESNALSQKAQLKIQENNVNQAIKSASSSDSASSATAANAASSAQQYQQPSLPSTNING